MMSQDIIYDSITHFIHQSYNHPPTTNTQPPPPSLAAIVETYLKSPSSLQDTHILDQIQHALYTWVGQNREQKRKKMLQEQIMVSFVRKVSEARKSKTMMLELLGLVMEYDNRGILDELQQVNQNPDVGILIEYWREFYFTSSDEGIDHLCEFLSEISGYSNNPTIHLCLEHLLKRCLFKSLLSLSNLTSPEDSIEKLNTLQQATQPCLKSKDSLDKVIQNIYLIAIESNEIHKALVQWIRLCITNNPLKQHLRNGNYVIQQLTKVILKIEELFTNSESIKLLIKDIKTLPPESLLAEAIIKQILSVNNKRIIQDHILQLIDFDIISLYPLIYSTFLPYALKAVDKIDQNVTLINAIVRIRFKARGDWNVVIKHQIFLKFFKHICHHLTSDNLCLLYQNFNPELFGALIEGSKKKVFQNQKAFLQYLLPQEMFSLKNIGLFEMAVKIVSLFRCKNEASAQQLHQKYYQKCWDCYLTITDPLMTTVMRMIGLESSFESEEASKESESLLNQLNKKAWIQTNEKDLLFILGIFNQQPSKASALALLRYIFFFLILSPTHIGAAITALLALKQKLDQSVYYLLRCYSSKCLDELLVIYSTQGGVNDQLLQALQSIIVGWINITGIRQVYHLYETARYEACSEFLKKRIRMLRNIDEQRKCKVFQSIDTRLCRFLKLFHRIISYENLNKDPEDETKCIIYNSRRNLLCLSYKFYEKQFDSPFEVMVTVDNNPESSQPCIFYIRQPNLEHKFVIVKDQITLTKFFKQDSKVIAEKKMGSYSSSLSIKLEVDLEKETAVVEINKEEFEFIVFRNSQKEGVGVKTLQTIEMGLESSDSYLQQFDIVYNTVKTLSFNMNTANQTQKRFTLNISQLNIIRKFNSAEYLSLKYLVVFILQIARNQLSYSLHSIDSIFPLIYRIVFHYIEFSTKTQFFGVFTFLEYVTKAIIEMASAICFDDIKRNTLKLMVKPNRMGLEFFKQIILNFQIWCNCSFVAQNLILEIIFTVLTESRLAEKLIVEDVSYFHEISEYIPRYYTSLAPSKNLKMEEKEELKEKVENILFELTTRASPELFSRYMSLVLKSSIQESDVSKFGKKSMTIKKAQGLIERIVQHCLPQGKVAELKRDLLFVALIKIKEFRVVADNISTETSNHLFEAMLALCKSKETSVEVCNSIKIILSSMTLVAIQAHFPQVLSFLQSSSKFKSQEKLITSLITPYLQRYQSFTLEIKTQILSYLVTLCQANSNISEKSSVFTVKLLATPEFIELVTSLCEDDMDLILKPQSKAVLTICWDSLRLMPKHLLFQFLNFFRKKAGTRLNILVAPILNFDVSKSSLVDCSLMVQYGYQCLLVYQMMKTQKNQVFFTSIFSLIEEITSHKSEHIYSIQPGIGKNANVDKMRIMDVGKKPFEIRGGILYKLVLLLFEYLRLTEEPKIVQKIRDIFIFNVDKSEDLRNFRKSRNSNIFGMSSEKSLSSGATHQFQLLIKRTTSQTEKDPEISQEVGFDLQGDKQTKEGPSYAHLQFMVLKLSIFLEHCVSSSTQTEVVNLLNELSHRYPHLNSQFNPDNVVIGETYEYSKFVKLFTEDVFDLIKAEPKLMDMCSPIRRTTSYQYQTISPIKRKYSTVPKDVPEMMKFQKENAPEKAQKLLKLEFAYRYILKNSLNSEDDPVGQEETQRILKEFKRYRENQNEIKQTNKNQANLYWKEFLDEVEGENGFLQETVYKKKPILMLRGVHLPNMVRGVTKLTENYEYQLMKQETLSLNQKQSFLSYSFLRPMSFVKSEERKSMIELIPPLMEEIESSGGLIKISTEWVTRRGVYFSRFNLDLAGQKISVQADINGRPDKPQYIYGSTKDSIIKGRSKSLQLKFSEIKEIFVRRYNQIPNNAIEIFTHQSNSYYFVFYSRKVASSLLKKLKDSGHFKEEQFIQSPEVTFKQRKYTQKWQSGKISNFEYLMLINIFSGRTFNDPNQYPIFPWVLSDYKSNEINLHNHRVYRNMGLPIGALNKEKLERYMENSKIHEEEEEYLYGSFLSTSMFVFYYLVRIEPFSSLARELQGGHFDSPDRLFNSMSDIWRSLTCESNTSDVKELIPEFYSVNVFLQNRNQLNFGKTQTGTVIDDVVLPPWAPDSNAFISIMREALESDFISSKLHLWIDLIFGNHQYSKERYNQFHPRYYEKNIDFRQVEKHEIEPLIAQITYFGQFPKKIFAKDHPQRIESLKRPLSFRQMHKQEMATGYVEKMKKYTDAFILSIHQNKLSKTYAIKIPFQSNIKRVEIEKSSQKGGELLLVESKDYAIYYKTTFQSVFLKRLQTDISFKKSMVSDRYVILCGKDLTVLDFQGKVVLTLSNVEPKAAIVMDDILVFFDKKFCLKRLSILSPQTIETIYSEEPIYSHCQLLGYRIAGGEGYLLCFNRSSFVYISN